MALTLGQYRFSGRGATSEMTPVLSYKPVSVSTGSSTDNASFYDVQISPNEGQFVQDQDYYLRIAIPRDMNYTMSFDLQLTKVEGSSEEVYQFIKNITLERGGTGDNVYKIVLFENADGVIDVQIPLPYVKNNSSTRNKIYYDAENDKYYIGLGGTDYQLTDKFNAMSVLASWIVELDDNYGVFEMVFRPIDIGFTHIHLRMVRTAEDYNIQRVNEDMQTEFGRKLDISKIRCELYQLINLVDTLSPIGILERIGIWSHPGLLMSINGEEIRVTASGFYELDAIPITSLGIVAKDNDYTDFFTIDYEYDAETEG